MTDSRSRLKGTLTDAVAGKAPEKSGLTGSLTRATEDKTSPSPEYLDNNGNEVQVDDTVMLTSKNSGNKNEGVVTELLDPSETRNRGYGIKVKVGKANLVITQKEMQENPDRLVSLSAQERKPEPTEPATSRLRGIGTSPT